MQAFENKVQSEISAGKIPGSVVVARNTTGSFAYTKAHGPRSLKDGENSESLKTDGIFWLASCTKLLTSISALQCVERGQFTLDEDVTRLLPELKDIDILKGFEPESDKPILVKATKTITLRQFLTHTSGLAYDVFNPELGRWRASRGETPSLTTGTVLTRNKTPLLFEPGESWIYSTGLDWAGVMVERANNMDLETYMKKYIFAPLGHTDFAFFIEAHPDLHRRLVPMTLRAGGEIPGFGTAANPDGALSHLPNPLWTEGQSDCAGGAGGYASVPAYQAVLHSLLLNDGTLLTPAMNDELFRPQLTDAQLAVVSAAMQLEPLRYVMAPGLPAGVKLDYALGGMISMEDVEGQRRKGAMHWGGLPNLSWWCDREAGVSGMYASQLIPTGDKRCAGMFGEFEKGVYESMGKLE